MRCGRGPGRRSRQEEATREWLLNPVYTRTPEQMLEGRAARAADHQNIAGLLMEAQGLGLGPVSGFFFLPGVVVQCLGGRWEHRADAG